MLWSFSHLCIPSFRFARLTCVNVQELECLVVSYRALLSDDMASNQYGDLLGDDVRKIDQ